MSYADRAGPGTLNKPRCFGDPEEHSPKDDVCQDCRWFQTCAVVVRSKLREEDKGDRGRDRDRDSERERGRRDSRYDDRDRSRDREPRPEDYPERKERVPFFVALLINGGLSGVRAGFREAMYATDQIPRFPYEDPFAIIMRKKRSTDADEDR